MLSNVQSTENITNIFGEVLSLDLYNFTENVNEKMQMFWDMITEGNPINKKKYEYLRIEENVNLDIDSDDTEDEN